MVPRRILALLCLLLAGLMLPGLALAAPATPTRTPTRATSLPTATPTDLPATALPATSVALPAAPPAPSGSSGLGTRSGPSSEFAAVRDGLLLLAQTYMNAGDYANAARVYAELAEQDPGNPQALAGLQAALQKAKAAAPTIAAAAAAPALPVSLQIQNTPDGPAEADPTPLAGLFSSRFQDLAASALAALLLVAALYVVAQIVRWLLYGLREAWFRYVSRLFGQPARSPGFVIGEFVDATGTKGFAGERVVTQAIAEKLLAWNQLVRTPEVPVAPADALDLGSMAWIKVFWSWILPPARGYRVTGTLMRGSSSHQLAVQRVCLAHNSLDSCQTFESEAKDPEQAYWAMASEAAKWLLKPEEMEADAARAAAQAGAQGGKRSLDGEVTASDSFDQALDLLLPVRRQLAQGNLDLQDARERVQEAGGLIAELPAESSLRRDLVGVVRELERVVGPASGPPRRNRSRAPAAKPARTAPPRPGDARAGGPSATVESVSAPDA